MREFDQIGPPLDFGPYLFDPTSGKLTKYGTPIRLNGMPLKILAHLLQRPGETASRKELQQLLWNDAEYGDFEKGLNSAVNLIRAALGDSANHPRYIETVPGQGYRFVAPVCRMGSVASGDQVSSEPTASVRSSIRGEGNKDGSAGSRETVRALHRARIFVKVGAALAVVTVGVGIWWLCLPKSETLLDGSTLKSNIREANDQFNLAFQFIEVQNDVPLARRTSERAIALDPNFAAAHVQHALFSVIELWCGYNADSHVVLEAEQELHRAERKLPDSDGLLLAARTAVYLAQGRLDRVPAAKLEEFTRRGGDPTWLAILRLLAGRTDEGITMLQQWTERGPLHNPARMFLGEMLRTKGKTANAVRLLERALQQAPRQTTPAFFLTLAYLDAGRIDQAEGLLTRMRPDSEKNYLWRFSWAILLASKGMHAEAGECMDEEVLQSARINWAQWSLIADFYALQGDKERALNWLEFAIARGDERAFYFRRNARLQSLHDDMRFNLLLKNLESRPAAFILFKR